MEAHCQSFLLNKGEIGLQSIRNVNESPFETIFIPDGDFEVISSQLPSCSGIDFLKSPDVSNFTGRKIHVSENYLATDIRDSDEELLMPRYFSSVETQEESFVLENQEAHKLKIKWDGLVNKNKGCDWRPKEDPSITRARPDNNILNNISNELSSHVSSSNNEIQESIKRCSSPQITKDYMLENEVRDSKLKQKEEYLKQSLHRVNELLCKMKTIHPNTVVRNNPGINEHVNDNTVNNLSTSKPIESMKFKVKSSKITDSNKRGGNVSKTSNLHLDFDSQECDIEGFKDCIIEASRSLIKTEKSLRVLGKLIHKDVLIEKREAIKYLKNFQYTVNTFRKTMNGIEKNLSAQYGHLIHHVSNEYICETNLLKDGMGVNEKKQFEIIIPAGAAEEVSEMSNNSSNQGACDSNTSEVQRIQPKKRKKGNKHPSPKKIKTRIVYGNWSNGLGRNSAKSKNLYGSKSIQSSEEKTNHSSE